MKRIENLEMGSIIDKLLVFVVVSWCTLGIFYIIGSYIEQNFFQVRIDQKISNIEYIKDKGYLCWDWYSVKTRSKPAVNMGVKLKDAENKTMVLTTFNRYSLVPWQLSNPVPLGRVNQPLCTFIPPGYAPKEPFTVNQYVEYPGLMNFWNITTNLPTIHFTQDDNVKSTDSKEINKDTDPNLPVLDKNKDNEK